FGTFRPAVLDCDGAALDPAKLTQPLQKSGYPLSLGRTRARAQEANRLRRLLRVRRERPRHRRTAEQRDELAPPHVEPPPPESVHRTLSLPQSSPARPMRGPELF